jgi:hypothetical protein
MSPGGRPPFAIIVEIVSLIIVAAIVEWSATALLHTHAFWPLMLAIFVYLGIRLGRLVRNRPPG